MNCLFGCFGCICPALRSTQQRAITLEDDQRRTSEDGQEGDKKVPISLSDLRDRLISILECPVCMEIMTTSILQCSSGHSFCSNCIKRVPHCPICSTSVSNPVRNINLEKIREEMAIPCPNAKHGCPDKVLLKIDPHLNCCQSRELNCPISQASGMFCFWKGPHSHFLEHAMEAHPQATLTGNNIPCAFELKTLYGLDVKFLQCQEGLFIIYTEYMTGQTKTLFTVQYAGHSDTASKFVYQITFPLPRQSTKITYTRKVHTIDDNIRTVFDTEDCIVITERGIQLSKQIEFVEALGEKCKMDCKLSVICV